MTEPNQTTPEPAPTNPGCAILTFASVCICVAGIYLILIMLWS